MADSLRLAITETDDLQVVSAHLQDAITVVGNMTYLPRERRFAVVFSRFRWETADKRKADNKPFERVQTGLHFDGVLGAQSHRIRRDRPDGVLELLAIQFEPGEAPGGVIELQFAGGGAVRLTVECLDGHLSDMSEPWKTQNLPQHDLEESDGEGT